MAIIKLSDSAKVVRKLRKDNELRLFIAWLFDKAQAGLSIDGDLIVEKMIEHEIAEVQNVGTIRESVEWKEV